MGYYSEFNYSAAVNAVDAIMLKVVNDFLKTKNVKTKEILAAVKASKDHLILTEEPRTGMNVPLYGFAEAETDYKDGDLHINVAENYGKFYDCDLFAALLTFVIKRGEVDLDFIGEDGERWGFRVKPGYYYEKEYTLQCSLKAPVYITKEV